jgi:AmmeMemoRadiSam system protein A
VGNDAIEDRLTDEEKTTLLRLARQAIEEAVRGRRPPEADPACLTPRLRAAGATFVTLTMAGDLRGCVGALDAYQPLFEDVREHAVGSALQDFRFPPLRADEVDGIRIEISRLTAPAALEYRSAQDLLAKLRPGVDGVILRDGPRRATFLPQVWDKIPDPAAFLDNLCAKMGAAPDLWQRKPLSVQVYQVEEFHEAQVPGK